MNSEHPKPADEHGGAAKSIVCRPRLLVTLFSGGFYWETQRVIEGLQYDFDIRFVTLSGVASQKLWPALAPYCFYVASYDFRRRSWIRNLGSLMRATWQKYAILRNGRFDGALGVGVNLSVPLAIAAKLRGLPFVFVESVSRVTRPSLTGRLLSLLNATDRLYVQWPEATRMYRKARYEGSVL